MNKGEKVRYVRDKQEETERKRAVLGKQYKNLDLVSTNINNVPF